MFERFTSEARAVVVAAQEEARALHHPYLGTEHLLLGLLRPQAGLARTVLERAGVRAAQVREDIVRLAGAPVLGAQDAEALRSLGIDLDLVLARIEESFGPAALAAGEQPTRARRGSARLTRRAKKVLELSLREAVHLHHRAIGSEHVLLGLLREGDGLATRVLTDAGVSPAALRTATLAALDEAA